MIPKEKLLIIIIIVIVAVLAGLVYWVWVRNIPPVPAPANLPENADQPREASSEITPGATEAPPADSSSVTTYNTPHFDAPLAYRNPYRAGGTNLVCDNGIWRVRATSGGILWFDFYHAREKRWYLNKNDLDFITVNKAGEMSNSELDAVPIKTELVASNSDSLQMNYEYDFTNGVKIRVELTLNKGDPLLHFKFYSQSGTAKIQTFIATLTDGQSEAVQELSFDQTVVRASSYQSPLPGKSLELQKMEYYPDLTNLEFHFHGPTSEKKDPNNPWWMGRYLGLQQYLKIDRPLRQIFGDRLGVEIRDVPWQPDWKLPAIRPWIEGIWLERNDKFIEGDSLTYGITNYGDYQ